MLVYLYTFRIDEIFSDRGRVFGIKFFQISVLSPILELGEKVFPGEVVDTTQEKRPQCSTTPQKSNRNGRRFGSKWD
jgi:hypothetical protein